MGFVAMVFVACGDPGDLVGDNGQTSIIHNGATYNTVTSPYTGKVWLDRNLGASQVCQTFDDTACYGDYYQWGRNFDGHQDPTSKTTETLAGDVNNAGDKFITYPIEWASVDIDGSIRNANWSKTDGSSVCPVGFRVPTIDELAAETILSGASFENTMDAFSNFLKLPSAGFRIDLNGAILEQGKDGFVWSNSISGVYSSDLHFSGVITQVVYEDTRSYGYSVRCIKN